MMSPARRTRILFKGLFAIRIVLLPPGAQAQPGTDAQSRDYLFQCATRIASGAGFQSAPGSSADRVSMMRSRTLGDSVYVDAFRITLAAPGSAAAAPLNIRTMSFVTASASIFSRRGIPTPKTVTALADSIRRHCRRRGT